CAACSGPGPQPDRRSTACRRGRARLCFFLGRQSWLEEGRFKLSQVVQRSTAEAELTAARLVPQLQAAALRLPGGEPDGAELLGIEHLLSGGNRGDQPHR